MSISEIYDKLGAAADHYSDDAIEAMRELKEHLEEVADKVKAVTDAIGDGDAAVRGANDGASKELDDLVERAGKIATSVEAVGRAVEASVNELDESITDLDDVATGVRDWKFGG